MIVDPIFDFFLFVYADFRVPTAEGYKSKHRLSIVCSENSYSWLAYWLPNAKRLKSNTPWDVLLTNAPRPCSSVIKFLRKINMQENLLENVITSGEATIDSLKKNHLTSADGTNATDDNFLLDSSSIDWIRAVPSM